MAQQGKLKGGDRNVREVVMGKEREQGGLEDEKPGKNGPSA